MNDKFKTMRESLISQFAKAGLKLEITDNPLGGRGINNKVFGMDIQRKTKGNWRNEYFRIWPGGEENNIQVINVDKKTEQLVLMVHEKKQEFTETVKKHSVAAFKPNDIVRVLKNGDAIVRRHTSGNKRHFLLGVDERQMFIAQLPEAASTVRQAHDRLKAPTVWLYEGKQAGRTIRQGEWFFLNVDSAEQGKIEHAVKNGLVRLKIDIASGIAGRRVKFKNEHVAEELVIVEGTKLERGLPIRERDIFVRGSVRHPEHKTVSFKNWRKVIRNTESNEGRMSGVGWID